VRAVVLAVELARRAAATTGQLHDTFWVALLGYLGCTGAEDPAMSDASAALARIVGLAGPAGGGRAGPAVALPADRARRQEGPPPARARGRRRGGPPARRRSAGPAAVRSLRGRAGRSVRGHRGSADLRPLPRAGAEARRVRRRASCRRRRAHARDPGRPPVS